MEPPETAAERLKVRDPARATDFFLFRRSGTIAVKRGRSTIYDDSKLKEDYKYGKHVL